MVLLVQDILKDAMSLIGVIAGDEVPDTSQYALALRTANVMIDRWASQRLLLRSTTTLTIPLVVGQPSYTIGVSGADVTSPKPIKLYSAFTRDDNNFDTPIEIITQFQYNELSDKTVQGQPVYVAYDPGDTQQTINKGTVFVYYAPFSADTLYVECDNYLTEFVNLTDAVSFEPAYYEALIYNLAVRLFRYYRDASITIPIDISTIAQNSINNLKAMNAVLLTASMEFPGKFSKWNIYTDAG